MNGYERIPRCGERGAALVIGLVLLLVVTLLAVSGMGTATMELRMANNTKLRQDVFELAETGIERTLAAGSFDTTQPVTATATVGTAGSVTTTTTCSGVSDPPPPPPMMDGIFSLGSTVSATHFEVISTGTAQRGASATHTQGFYIIGPAGGTTC